MLNYCDVDPSEALKNSKLLKVIDEGKLSEKFSELEDTIYQEAPIPNEDYWLDFLGQGGDCGNFGIALNRHLCNKGLLLALVNQHQSLEDVPFSHIVLQYGDAIIDSKDIHHPERTDPAWKGRERLKERLAEKWVDDPDFWDMYGNDYAWDKMSSQERLDVLDPIAISTTEDEIMQKLPRTTYEDRITHIRDFLCRVEGDYRFDRENNRCKKVEGKYYFCKR